jgi:predicted Zn finger-like uncharacterized protein
MFTVCPKCALTLVVTAADLRVAQGYVRCGRCSSVFNALARLSDDRQSGAEADEAAPLPGAEPPEAAHAGDADLSPLEAALSGSDDEGSDAIPEGALEFNPDTTDVGAVFVAPPPNPQWTAATGSFKAMRDASQAPEAQVSEPHAEPASKPEESQVDVEIDGAFLANMLGEAAPPSPAQPEPQRAESPRSRPAEPQAPAATRSGRPAASAAGVRPAVRPSSPHIRPPAEATARPRVAAAHEHAPRAHEAMPVPEETPVASPESAVAALAPGRTATHRVLARVDSRAWGAGAALALLVLVAQIVNHNRDELAANPRFSHPLTALYGSIGVQLMPHWDLRAYDVRQLGASADPRGSGLITVRASIKNAGHLAQPLPLLRVTLQDRFGNRIAARDVAPRSYVPHTIPDTSYLAGGQRIDAEMGFVDPGANAVGFEIDACLPGRGGAVTCANDLAAR